MNTLIYIMTHSDDPNSLGVWGIEDCMGKIRARDYGAVIGVAGKTWWDGKEMFGRIRWIGINPHKTDAGMRGPLVAF